MSNIPRMRFRPILTTFVNRRSSCVTRLRKAASGAISSMVALAEHIPAAGQAARLRPSVEEERTIVFDAVHVALSGVPGMLMKVKLGSIPHGSGYEPCALNCVPADHGGVILQYESFRGVPATK